jgi:hypothetical protein
MNSKTALLVFMSVLLMSRIVNSEAWTKREREPVNRNGVAKLNHRRTKSEKSKGEKKDKKEKSGKDDKKYSKTEKYNFNGDSDYNTGHHSNYNNPPISEGFLDEDITNDFKDIYDEFYDEFFHSHFSFGSMSMDYVRPVQTSNKMLTFERNEPHENPTLEHDEPYNKATSSPSKALAMSPKTHDDIRISFNLYSLIFSFVDSVVPTRREDYNELVTGTESIFKDFMIRSYGSNIISDLNDFQVEFLRTGVSEFDKIFIVFQSTAIFDSDSYAFPEAFQVQDMLGDALGRDKELWMEYITILQELNPDNAFSSTVNVVYVEGIPTEKESIQSTSSSSRANKIAYSAAGGVILLSIVAFVVKRSRDKREFEDPYFHEKKSASRSIENCESTISETLTYVSSSIYGEQNQSYCDRKDQETGSIIIGLSTQELTDHRSLTCIQNLSDLDSVIEDDSINDGLSERIRDLDNCRMLSFDSGTFGYVQEQCNDTITNAAVSGNPVVHDENSHSSNKQWYSLQERRSKVRKHPKKHTSKNQRENSSLFDEDKHESQEKLRAELAIIKEEEVARAEDELRLKEERRLAVDRESFETRSRLRDYARRAEELKLEKAKSYFETFANPKKEKLVSFEQCGEEVR